jgi:hypothetical protein
LRAVTFRTALIAAFLLLSFAAPASAADTVLTTFDGSELDTLGAFRDRVAWTETGGTLMTVEDGRAVAVNVERVGRLDVAPGPDGKPVAVYDRCRNARCRYFLYDFAAKRERKLMGPTAMVANWAFWRDRFAVIRNGRLVIVPVKGKRRDVGRAESLEDKGLDYNGAGVSYVNEREPEPDVEEYGLAYWPATGPGSGRELMRVAHGASGDLSLDGPFLTASRAYAVQRAGELGGPWRLWRVPLRGGAREYAGLPAHTVEAVPLGSGQAVAEVCPSADDEDEPCRLVLHPTSYRRP